MNLARRPDGLDPLDAYAAVAFRLEELRRRLDDGGIETHDTDEIVGRPRFFCRDPFGNRVELTEWQGA